MTGCVTGQSWAKCDIAVPMLQLLRVRTGLDSYLSVHKGKNIIQEVDVLSLDIQDHIWFHIQAHI